MNFLFFIFSLLCGALRYHCVVQFIVRQAHFVLFHSKIGLELYDLEEQFLRFIVVIMFKIKKKKALIFLATVV